MCLLKSGIMITKGRDLWAVMKSMGSSIRCTISVGHGIIVIPSWGQFRGSRDINFVYLKLDDATWQSNPSSSLSGVRSVWVFAINGVAEGLYNSTFIYSGSDSIHQRPAL